jgi:alkanesulfonate monooxygenase
MTQARDVEFIGMIQPRAQSEIHPPSGPAIDPGYLRASAQAHDEGGFDRILVGWFSNGPDGLQIAAHAGAHTKRVGFLVAHRPGFQSPTTAARAFATLDQLTGGRAAIHVISGGDDADQARDGDWLGKEDRYARTDEYVSVLKAVWTAGAPVDHEGAFYRIRAPRPRSGPCSVRASRSTSAARPRRPFAWPASTPMSTPSGARRGRRCARSPPGSGPRPPATGARSASACPSARSSRRRRRPPGPRRSASWAASARCAARPPSGQPATGRPRTQGSQRLLAAAARGDRPEGRLYTAIARETGARGNTTALVGTPRQVAEALLEYHALGVSTFLIRGFDPLEDAVEYGRELLPITRRMLAERLARTAPAMVAG